jgi:predicted ABC-type transport system involved in lysophospholipase L1 biosynthesis ATPase subunit/GNAT superfamily N-acetyltransferase
VAVGGRRAKDGPAENERSGDRGSDGSLRVTVSVTPSHVPQSARGREVRVRFGIAPKTDTTVLVDGVNVRLRAGQILLVGGPSGSGKSAVLECLAEQLDGRAIRVDRQDPGDGSAIVDQVAPGRPLAEALSVLTACGLGEPRLWLRRSTDLSDGERFRLRLAMAMGQGMRRAGGQGWPGSVLIADEFCAVLHRRLARAIAFNLRKLISSSGLRLIAATTHEDLRADLQPDWLLCLGGRAPSLQACEPVGRPISFSRRLHVVPGRVSDYRFFEAMHYRQRQGLGPVDKVFVLRDGAEGPPLGVVVYGFPALALRMRNVATGGAYHCQWCRLNRDFRTLRRLVIHPDVRGCGLGRWLVARTLPQVGTRYVECLAAMGTANPVFERAGMVRLGAAEPPVEQQRACEALGRLGIDPLAEGFERAVARRSTVRRIVAQRVHRWLETTTSRPVVRIRAMTGRQLAAAYVQLMGARPVYYLWSAHEREMVRLKHLTR